MRLLFLGSGEFGLPTLEALHGQHDVAAVVSQPDRPAGRKRKLTPTPIAAWAEAQGLTVLKTDNVNTDAFVAQVEALAPEAAVVVAFGQKLSPALLDALGPLAVNLHGSLLPKYRGAAPVNWAMIEGERTTGVTVIALAQRMDAGVMYAKASLAIDPHETAGELHDRLAQLGPGVITDVLDRFAAGVLEGEAQDEAQATRAPKLSKADGTVRFDQPAAAVRARVHGLTPWPGCRVRWQCQRTGQHGELILRRVEAMDEVPAFLQRRFEGQPLPSVGTVMEQNVVIVSEGVVRLLEVQGPGTRPMAAGAFGRGHGLGPGDRLEPLAGDA